MSLTLREILAFDVLDEAGAEVLTCADRLDRPVRWVHSSEIYEIGPLLSGGELLLTTGLGLAGADAGACRHYVRELAERGVAAVAVEVGRSLPEVPYALVDESRRRQLPLVALRRVVPFIRITEAANTAIVMRAAADPPDGLPPDREGRCAALLADLEEGTALGQPEVTARARAVGFRPGRAHRLTGVAAHGAGGLAAAVVDRAARELGGPVLCAVRSGTLTALLAVPAAGPADPVRAARQALLTAAADLPAAGDRPDGAERDVVMAVGHPVAGDAVWRRWGEALREARGALRLALTVPSAEPGRPPAGSVLVTSSRALALERELVGDGLDARARDRLGKLVTRALGPLLEWEAAHPSDLVRTLEVHLRHGCSPTRTAALLHVGRQSLYQRLERIESLLGVPVADPDAHAELLLATAAHRVLRAAV